MFMDDPSTSVLTVEKIPLNDDSIDGYIAKATINRPNKLNALNAEVMDSLKKFCAWVENDKSIRCVIIAGAKPLPAEEGKRPKPNAFVAGADISEFVGMDSVATKIKFTDNAVEALWGLTKPTIAMVDGFALGGGCEVACSCDIRIASDRAKFGTPEINTTTVEATIFRGTLSHVFSDTRKGNLTVHKSSFEKMYQNLYASGYDGTLVTMDGYRDPTERDKLIIS